VGPFFYFPGKFGDPSKKGIYARNTTFSHSGGLGHKTFSFIPGRQLLPKVISEGPPGKLNSLLGANQKKIG